MALDADTGKVGLGIQVQHLPERRAAAPRRLGLARRRSGNRQHLRARAAAPQVDRAEQGRQAALGALDRRGVRRVHHARRPHDVAGRRRRSRHRQRRRSRTGARRRNRAHRFIALDKRTGDIVYVVEPGRPSVRHGVRRADSSRRSTACGCSSPASATAAIHAIKPQTGEKVWSFVAAKRAINTGVVVNGNTRDRVARRREPRQAASSA